MSSAKKSKKTKIVQLNESKYNEQMLKLISFGLFSDNFVESFMIDMLDVKSSTLISNVISNLELFKEIIDNITHEKVEEQKKLDIKLEQEKRLIKKNELKLLNYSKQELNNLLLGLINILPESLIEIISELSYEIKVNMTYEYNYQSNGGQCSVLIHDSLVYKTNNTGSYETMFNVDNLYTLQHINDKLITENVYYLFNNVSFHEPDHISFYHLCHEIDKRLIIKTRFKINIMSHDIIFPEIPSMKRKIPSDSILNEIMNHNTGLLYVLHYTNEEYFISIINIDILKKTEPNKIILKNNKPSKSNKYFMTFYKSKLYIIRTSNKNNDLMLDVLDEKSLINEKSFYVSNLQNKYRLVESKSEEKIKDSEDGEESVDNGEDNGEDEDESEEESDDKESDDKESDDEDNDKEKESDDEDSGGGKKRTKKSSMKKQRGKYRNVDSKILKLNVINNCFFFDNIINVIILSNQIKTYICVTIDTLSMKIIDYYKTSIPRSSKSVDYVNSDKTKCYFYDNNRIYEYSQIVV